MYSQQKLQYTKTSLHGCLSKAKIILQEYDLCNDCTGRLFAKKMGLVSHNLLGKKIKNSLNFKSSKNCYICKGILSNLQTIVNRMIEKSLDYEFDTFIVGAILKPSVIDRDDIIRSKFTLRGIDSVKAGITQQLAKNFAKKTKTKIDVFHPDLTFTFNFKNDSCELKAKSVHVYGKYVKKIRGSPQKQTLCTNCNGKGCTTCNYSGFLKNFSIEGRIIKLLLEKFEGTQIKISWIGGEDKNSLVLGSGRPFFAKILNPKKRKVKLKKKYIQDKIEIRNLKIISNIPKGTIRFSSKIKLSIITEQKLKSTSLSLIKILTKTPIIIYEKPNKQTQKFIYNMKFLKSSPKSFTLLITADGGLPIKRFVEGNNVKPNLSELLGNKCKCDKFDFQDIELRNH